ncbi:MAG: hypothetical protein HZB26_22540 [Candidatus Hydrogenedentes bacterium]|nr:hypothetical protein [Candidatus Hydrogenedentota bacterium]
MMTSVICTAIVAALGAECEGASIHIGFDAFREVFAPESVGAIDSPQAKRYVAEFDCELEDLIKGFDFEKGLLDLHGEMPPPQIAELDRLSRKVYAERKEYRWLYQQSRQSASVIGNMALAWALPISEHSGDERFRQGVIRGIQAYLEHQAPSGEFQFCSIRFSSVYGTHEMAWRLEPLLAAYLCIRHTLPPEQDHRFYEGLLRAAQYLYDTPCSSETNRGCVWCGVMAGAAKVFSRPEYAERARQIWAGVGPRVFDPSGQVVEGLGPDMGYSFISLLYTFRHRTASKNAELDAPLMRALDWFSTVHDSNGLPMQFISSRTEQFAPDRLAYLLSALEYYARERPYYATLAHEYFDILGRSHGHYACDHGGIPWITAALYHNPAILPAPLPDSLLRFTTEYSGEVTGYLNVRRDYSAVVVFGGVKDLCGLQHWTLAGERPLICESPKSRSSVKAWGLDTSRSRVLTSHRRDSSDLETASIDWGGIRTCYVFGDGVTWVFDVAPNLKREVSWAINKNVCAEPRLEDGAIRTEKQKSRINAGPVAPCLDEVETGWHVRVVVPDNQPVDWTIFHDGSAGPVTAGFKDGILTANLTSENATYDLVYNAGERAFTVDEAELKPRQVRVRRAR